MSFSRPSFMATITVRVDQNTVIVSDDIAEMYGGLRTLNAGGSANYETALDFAIANKMLNERVTSRTGVSRRVAPISCHVQKNTHMEPNEASITISNEMLGVDWRRIVGGVVQIYAGTVSHAAYAKGMRELSYDRMVDPSSQLVQSEDKSIFTGYFTKVKSKGNGKFSTITIDTKDITFDLLTLKIPTAEMKDLPDGDLPLDQWIKQLLLKNSITSTIVRDVVHDGRYVMPKAADESTVHPGKKTRKGKRRISPRLFGTISYWEMIVDMCIAVGWIPNVEGVYITLRKANTFFGKESWRDTMFRRVIDGSETYIRRFQIGENVLDIEGERDLTFNAVPIIKVVASHYGNPVYAIYPKDNTPGEENSAYTSTGLQRDRSIKVIPVGTVSSIDDLEAIAKYIWENAARNEFSGTITTTVPFSTGGDNDDPDVLYLNVGDAIEVVNARGRTKIAGYVVNKDVPGNQYIKKHFEENALTDNIYRVNSVTHSFSPGNYECSIGYHNWYNVKINESHKPSIFSNAEIPIAAPQEGGVD